MMHSKLLDILLLFLSHLDKLQGDYNFFVAKKWKNQEYRCVTNSSFALSWIGEEAIESQVSTYVPELSHDQKFNCDIADDKTTLDYYVKDPWILTKSFEWDVNNIILDERWEDMEIIKTEYVSDEASDLQYKSVLSTLNTSFEIPLSIRTKYKAHIFLCDGVHPPASNCYWFKLQAWNGNGTAIEKCKKNSIPSVTTLHHTTGSCFKLVTLEHQNFPNYLSDSKWSHFKLRKKGNYTSFTQLFNNEDKIILEVEDKERTFNVTHMVIHSETADALWKIHQLEYIYTNKESNNVRLGPFLNASYGSVCVSMFVSMCKSCRLNLTLVTEDGDVRVESYTSLDSNWRQIKFSVDDIFGKKIRLLISTIGKTSERFWAIDKIRQCQKKEFRVISSLTQASCQLMSGENNVINNNDKRRIDLEYNCPEDSIGEFCVPCNLIYDDCTQISICSKDPKSPTRCYCSPGYQHYGNCYYPCNIGFYGHGCKKRCNYCKHCNNINGTCYSCSEDYTGLKCDMLNAIIFDKPPKVTDVNYTKCTVYVSNFAVKNGKTDNPATYAVQYKEVSASSQKWMTFNSNNAFDKAKYFTIKNLKPETEYSVRCVITTDKNKTYTGDKVPYSTFTTKCREISENMISLKPSHRSVEIYVTQNTNFTCKTLFTIGNKTLLRSSNTSFDQLTPFTKYTIYFHSGSKTSKIYFRTTEWRPEAVRNLKVTNKSSTSISLNWESSMLYGRLKHYVVEYTITEEDPYGLSRVSHLLKTKKCSSSTKLGDILKVEKTYVTVTDLVPSSTYKFIVYAINSAFDGEYAYFTASTSYPEEIRKEEIPEIIQIIPRADNTRIKLKINCVEPRLTIMTTLTCANEWCNNSIKTYHELQEILLLRNLIPFSNYTLELRFCRDNIICSDEMKSLQFQTKPTIPHSVNDIVVYSKSNDSISLRYKAPYPPTGILASYRLNYSYSNINLTTEYAALYDFRLSCKLWPEFHCIELSNLVYNEKYVLTLEARNTYSKAYGPAVTVRTVTKTEPSEPPFDLRLFWTTNTDLELEWKHPNQSNGIIKYFLVEVIPVGIPVTISKRLPVTERTFNLTYYYTVDAKYLQSSTMYEVKISAFNDEYGKNVTGIDTSPPEVPFLNENIQLSSSEDTITMTISARSPQHPFDNFTVILLISDEHINDESHSDLIILNLKTRRIVSECNITRFNETYTFVIGDQDQGARCNRTVENFRLTSDTFYNITVILKNIFKGKSSYNLYNLSYRTKPTSLRFLPFLPVIFIVGTAVFVCILFFSKQKHFRRFFKYTTDQETKQNENYLISDQNESDGKYITYENTGTDLNIFSKIIRLEAFQSYVQEAEKNGMLSRQHETILYSPARKIYEISESFQYFDYIDMEYSDGSKISKAYIATEAPKANDRSRSQFWKTVWEENIEHMILIDDAEKEKFQKYWPDGTETVKFQDNITVQLLSEKVSPTYTYRKFVLTKQDVMRHIDQIYMSYTGFNPEKFVPLFKKMSEFSLNSLSPICVHSSGGLRGTGFVLLCDMCLRMAAKEDSIDVLRNLQRLCNQNDNLVDSVKQYKLVHHIISEYLLGVASVENLERKDTFHKLLTLKKKRNKSIK